MNKAVMELKSTASLLSDMVKEYAAGVEDPEIVEALANETDLARQAVKVLELAADAADFSDAIAERIKTYQARKKRYDDRAKKLREIVTTVMAQTGLQKIVEPEMTVSLTSNKPALVIDATADFSMWEAYPSLVTASVNFAFDKDAIKQAIQNGDGPNWAAFAAPTQTITVRAK